MSVSYFLIIDGKESGPYTRSEINYVSEKVIESGRLFKILARKDDPELLRLHCSNCSHEWDTFDEDERCSWCGSPGYFLDFVNY